MPDAPAAATTLPASVCAACGAALTGRFCAHCGASADAGECPRCHSFFTLSYWADGTLIQARCLSCDLKWPLPHVV